MHADPVWMKALLVIHVACGSGAFLLAPVALLTAKGGKQHRRWGMVYLYAMGGVATIALPMSLYGPVLFLAMVAVFSFYAAFSGYRVLKLKNLARGGSARMVDWMAAAITLCSSAALAIFGAFRPAWVQNMGIVSIVFGCLGMLLALSQMKSFLWKPTEKMFWWYTHLGNLIGSYIAAWTAFLVTAAAPLFRHAGMLPWLLPTALGVPAIVATIIYYKRKFASKVAVPV